MADCSTHCLHLCVAPVSLSRSTDASGLRRGATPPIVSVHPRWPVLFLPLQRCSLNVWRMNAKWSKDMSNIHCITASGRIACSNWPYYGWSLMPSLFPKVSAINEPWGGGRDLLQHSRCECMGHLPGKTGRSQERKCPKLAKAEMTTMGAVLCVTWGQRPAPPKASLRETCLV